MKIVRLAADGFMRIRAVEITPEGDVVTLSGENGAGKSSVLNAIQAAVGGAKAVPGVPIHQGQDEATIELDLGEITVKRRFWDKDKTDVIITAANGARFQRPQQMLDGLIGKISFDPLNGFMRLKPMEQLEMLRKLVTLDVDVDALKGLNATDFEKRTDVNREVKSLQAQADAIVLPPDCPTEKRDTQEILDRLTSAAQHNADVEARRQARATATDEIATAHERIERVKAATETAIANFEAASAELVSSIDDEIKMLQQKRERVVAKIETDRAAMLADAATAEQQIQKRADDLKEKLGTAGPLPSLIDVEAVRAELTSAQDTNALVTRWEQRSQIAANAAMKKVESDRLTAAMAERDRQREEAMKRAKFPIEGLSFGDNEVLFNGLPLTQASTGEQIRVAMAIATALNPKLRVICIREASFLSQSGLRLVAEMAAESDIQVWLEDNRSTDPAAIVIEDGAVKGQVIRQQQNPPLGAMEPPHDGPADMGRTAGEIAADKAPPETGRPKGEPKPAPTKLL